MGVKFFRGYITRLYEPFPNQYCRLIRSMAQAPAAEYWHFSGGYRENRQFGSGFLTAAIIYRHAAAITGTEEFLRQSGVK